MRALIQELSPAYFAMVMATGIVSIAADELGPVSIGRALFYLNLMLYAAMAALHGLRLAWFPRHCIADLADTTAGPGYFTWIAATAVLGSQCIRLAHAERVATVLFVFAAGLWLMLSYAVFTALALRHPKRTLEADINGGWLLAVVAMQGIAVLATHLASEWSQSAQLELHFAALTLWLAGGMLYLWLATLIFYRYYFFELAPGDLVPTYWINMGAMAISTLAGSLLIAVSGPQAPFLHSLRPFLEGTTLFYWAGGTWWLPLLVILGIWRHVIRGYRLVYDPLYWGLVFPLGMYAVATDRMSRSMGLAFLHPVSVVLLYIALVAWGVTALGLVLRIAADVRRAVTER